MTSHTVTFLIALTLICACEEYEYPTFASYSPNQLDTADTGEGEDSSEPEPFDLLGEWWTYHAEVPGESDLGVPGEAERCFKLVETSSTTGSVNIKWRDTGGTAQDWTTTEYGHYSTTPDGGYLVDLRYAWSAVEDTAVQPVYLAYVVISEANGGADGYTTLGIDPCSE